MRPTEVWLITDTHFNHDNIKNYCNRPADFTERIIKQCRYVVQPQDIVFHLGDVIIGRKANLRPIMEQLPGRWILVMGNHDTQSPIWYMNNGFAAAVESIVYRDVLLTHKPAANLPEGAKLNIHGHYHNNPPDRWEFPVKDFHKLLAIEYTNYAPVLFNKFTCLSKTKQQNELTNANG